MYVVRHARKKITITVEKIRTFEEFLCGDERPLKEQRADHIVGEGFEVRLPKGHIQKGQLIDVCVEVADCRTSTY